VTVFQFVERQKAGHSIATLCRALRVSDSGYWAWRKRGRSRRQLEDDRLLTHVVKAYDKSRETYGAPRVHAELKDQGVRCGCKRVARIMGAEGVVGCHRRRTAPKTTRQSHL
jgi:putative transposase